MSFLFTQAEVIEGLFVGLLLCPLIFWATNRSHISGKAFGDNELRIKLIREIAPMITEGGSTDKENVLWRGALLVTRFWQKPEAATHCSCRIPRVRRGLTGCSL